MTIEFHEYWVPVVKKLCLSSQEKINFSEGELIIMFFFQDFQPLDAHAPVISSLILPGILLVTLIVTCPSFISPRAPTTTSW